MNCSVLLYIEFDWFTMENTGHQWNIMTELIIAFLYMPDASLLKKTLWTISLEGDMHAVYLKSEILIRLKVE